MATNRLPSLDALRAFAAFADTRNFSEAARRLHISQPALHTKIAGLAAQLDLALYVRRGPAIELTRQGEDLARFARSLLDRAHDGLAAIRAGASTEQVVLAAGAGAYLYVLGPALREFRRRSSARLQLATANEAQTVESLQKGLADVAVAPLPRSVAGIERRELLRFGQVLVMPSGHPLARRRKVALADLRGLPLILPPRGRPHRERIASALVECGFEPEVVAEADGWHLMMKFAALGVGMAIVNDYCERPRGLVAVPVSDLPKQALHVCRAAGPGTRPAGAALLWDIIHATTGAAR